MAVVSKWEVSDYLNTQEDIQSYLEEILKAAFEDNTPELILLALGDISRAKGMAKIAQDNNVGRESLYKSLSENGNPSFITVMKILRSLDIQLHTIPPAA